MAQSKFLTLSGLSKYDTKIKEWLKDNIKALGNKAFVHMCSLEAKETYNAFKITTNWTKSQNFMPTINIRGYAYQRKETIDCDIVMYHYNNEACNYSLTNKGSYPINVYQTFENNIQVFYIDPGEYFGMFNVFVYGGMGTESFSGWTMTTATAVSGTKIEQKPIATSITGNANYASSAGSSTYADRLGNANSYYTKTSLDTALSGKANTSHGNHVPKVQTASNKVFLRNDNTWQTITPANIGAAATTHGNHVPATQTASNKVFLRNDNTWATITPANIGAAATTHGNHVPATQTASNKVFLRNDNTWQTVTPANIGAAPSSHGHSQLTTESINDPNLAYSDLLLKYYTIGSSNSGAPGYAGKNYGFPVSHNANSILWFGNHGGNYGGQLGISGNGYLYYRWISSGSFPTTANGASWNRIAYTTDIPSSLPASDVYPWAKAANKPSYNFAEINAGNATIGDGTNRLILRTSESWASSIYHHTTADEAVVFLNKGKNVNGTAGYTTSWIFAYGNPADRPSWTDLTPAMQIKDNSVVINKLLGTKVKASYNLDVNGSANATTLYENGTRVSVDGHKHSDYATTKSVEVLTTIVNNGLSDLSTKYGTLTTSITTLQTTLGNVQTQVGTNTDKISVLDVAVKKLKDNKGSEKKPIYWKDGTPTECKYKLEKDVPSNAVFTDTNYYITGFSWVNGTTAGPTGTITRNGTSNITVNAIPAASGIKIVNINDDDNYGWSSNTPQSGIVTTDKQSFSGQKFFNNGIWIGTKNYEEEVGTDNVKIHFGDTNSVWIGEERDECLTLATSGTKITLNPSDAVVNIEYGTLTVNNEVVALQSDITPPVKYTTKTLSFASSMYLDNPTANYCTLCSFTNTISVSYPYFYIRFNTSYADGSMFHFIIKKTTNQTVTQYMMLYITTNISGATVKIAGLNTTYAYINKAFTSLEINVLYSNKVFYAIINQYK